MNAPNDVARATRIYEPSRLVDNIWYVKQMYKKAVAYDIVQRHSN